jgi:hypothetical protein
MATVATIAAAAIGAAGSIGGAAISSHGASQAAKAGRPQPQYIPLPKYASAINHQVARDLALNMGKTPPSFASYVDSGGTLDSGFQDPGLNPRDLRSLGLMYGGRNRGFHPIPLVPGSQAASGQLTPEQATWLRQYLNFNEQRSKHHWGGAK